jgi:hypothetical protein
MNPTNSQSGNDETDGQVVSSQGSMLGSEKPLAQNSMLGVSPIASSPSDAANAPVFGQAPQETSNGFPITSSYPFTTPSASNGLSSAAAQAEQQVEGWAEANGSPAPDVAKGVFEVDTRPSTDPLKIDDKK